MKKILIFDVKRIMKNPEHIISEGLNKITSYIYSLKTKENIRIIRHKSKNQEFSKEFYLNWYDSAFCTVPLQIKKVCKELTINSRFFENILIWTKYDLESTEYNVEEELIKYLEDPLFSIIEFIDEKFSQLPYIHKAIILDLQSSKFFQLINDESIILLNLIQYYKGILNDDSQVIRFFPLVDIPKELSDLILQLYISYFENRLSMLNPSQEMKSEVEENTDEIKLSNQLVWKGTQKELAELIIQLQRKGWVQSIENRRFKKTSRRILNLFDISSTKKDINSDELSSFNQLLKGNIDGESKERQYFLDTEMNYNRKFDRIEVNKNMQ